MWHTLFRGMSGDKREDGFFPTVTRFSGLMTPQDMYASTRLAAVEAVNAGITSIHSWCHNIRSRAYAEADVRAIDDTGLRGRCSFGQAIDQPPDKTILLADMEAMHEDWKSYSNGGPASMPSPSPPMQSTIPSIRFANTLPYLLRHIEQRFIQGLCVR
jgi:5-methylthioadenosine/S-adenosylhomocysteine deaminase